MWEVIQVSLRWLTEAGLVFSHLNVQAIMRGEQIAAEASHVWPGPLLALISYKTQTSFLNMVLQGRDSHHVLHCNGPSE